MVYYDSIENTPSARDAWTLSVWMNEVWKLWWVAVVSQGFRIPNNTILGSTYVLPIEELVIPKCSTDYAFFAISTRMRVLSTTEIITSPMDVGQYPYMPDMEPYHTTDNALPNDGEMCAIIQNFAKLHELTSVAAWRDTLRDENATDTPQHNKLNNRLEE